MRLMLESDAYNYKLIQSKSVLYCIDLLFALKKKEGKSVTDFFYAWNVGRRIKMINHPPALCVEILPISVKL